MAEREPVIGIDLGTTNSVVAWLQDGTPTVIRNRGSSNLTPSVVALSKTGKMLVGQIAKRQAITNPGDTVYAAKRLIGRKFSSPQAQDAIKVLPYTVQPGEHDDIRIQLGEKQYAVPEVSAMLLKELKADAEAFFGGPVRKAVITVPAYFNDGQRQATKDAGRIAGLEVLRIINEPTAAALAYGFGKSLNGKIAVFDLGGGTFDVSVLDVSNGVFDVIATGGDTYLGGEDFDNKLIDFLADRFKAANSGLDLRKDRMALQRLKEAAERAKHELSSATETEVNLPFITADASGPKHLQETINRSALEDLVKDLIERSIEPCKVALKDAGITTAQVNQVLLVGGMTRMPAVQAKVKLFFGKELHKGINPDEVVAVGAAIQGGVLKGEVKDVLLLDVTPLSLGVETAGGVFTKIIDKNTTIPCKKSQIFSTATDNQPLVSVHVLQGEREMAADNKTLARFELVGIPPAPRGVPQIEVTFDIDANGLVNVSSKDLGTGRVQTVKIVSNSGLTEAEIQKMVADAQSNVEGDKKKKELADLKNAADGLSYTTERSLEEYASMLKEKDRDEIKVDLENLKKQLGTGDPEKVRAAIKQLEGSAYRIADTIYAAETEKK